MKKHRIPGVFSLVPFLREDMKKHRIPGVFPVSFHWYPHGESLRVSYADLTSNLGMTSFAYGITLLSLSRRPLKTSNP